MTSAQRTHFESLLLAERRRTIRELSSITTELEEGGSQGDGLPDVADTADAARATMATMFDIAVANRESSGLGDIDAALERLYHDPESFGKCATCHQAIGLSRLEIVPATRFCARHARLA